MYFANVEDDTVVLDINTDAYFCLVGLAGLLEMEDDGAFAVSGRPVTDLLLENGLAELCAEQVRPRVRALPTPTRTSRTAVARSATIGEHVHFIRTVIHSMTAFPKRGLKQLIGSEADRPAPRPPCDEALIRRALLFDRWLPWVPFQGQCLYRAYTLRDFLRRSELDAQWVFGVRTWPFAAHCWLQVGDLILDDDIDRVKLYTPILVV